MTTPVSARDHANMTVAEREFTFDALLADFEELEERPHEVDTSTAAQVKESRVDSAVDLPVGEPRVSESQIGDRQARSRQAPDAAAPHSAHGEAAAKVPEAVPRRASMKRPSLALPSPEVLKLGALIVVAALSLTLVFIALSR